MLKTKDGPQELQIKKSGMKSPDFFRKYAKKNYLNEFRISE